MALPDSTPSAPQQQWLSPGGEGTGLRRYLQTLREHLWPILAVLLLTLGGAAAYLATATKTYEAEADLLVTPVPREASPALSGLPLIRDSSDPTRDVETAARLVTSTDVAARVKKALGSDRSPKALLSDVEAAPVAQSNIVAITARTSSAEGARRLADAFGRAVVKDRTEQLHLALDEQIVRLRARVRNLGPTAATTGTIASLPEQLNELETLRSGDDPTVRLETPAVTPTSPASPKPKLTIAAALFGGLLIGIGGAFAIEAVDPRVRREEQIRALFRIPILARVPKERRPRRGLMSRLRRGGGGETGVLKPGQLSPAAVEAYRTLRTTLTASADSPRGGRAILITGPSPSEGKTTTALNLAAALASTGERVILIEADLRRPTISSALGVRPRHGIDEVLLGAATMEDALVPVDVYGDRLRVLLVNETVAAGGWVVDWLALPVATQMLEAARNAADYVIVDSPPLTEVIDVLPLAQRVDDVLIVLRLGRTRLPRLLHLGELLAQHGIRPAGLAVVGVKRSPLSGSQYYIPQQAQLSDSRLGQARPERASADRP